MKKYVVKEDFYDDKIYKKKYTKGQVLYPDSYSEEHVIKLFDNNNEFVCDVDSPTYNEHIMCIDQDILNANHQYGCNYESDVITLYLNKIKNKTVKEINEERSKLYDEYTILCKCELSQLNNIIQNPVPTTKEELLEWNKTRKEAMERLNELLIQIESFAYMYHMEE